MVRSQWKSLDEVRRSLGNAKTISILSCAGCANICGTGGSGGIKTIKPLLQEWGKRVALAKVALFCCSEETVRQALRPHRKKLRRSDALVVLSCSSGVKSAFLNRSGVPVVAVLDTVGTSPITRHEETIAHGACTGCGHCVITCTGGICPIAHCPSMRKYEPCPKRPENAQRCVVKTDRPCVWTEIGARGDLVALKELGEAHRAEGGHAEQPTLYKVPLAAQPARTFTGWLMARGGRFFGVIARWMR